VSGALVEGARVGPYPIRVGIGVGSSAWVYDAIDERGGRGALKVLCDEARSELEFVARVGADRRARSDGEGARPGAVRAGECCARARSGASLVGQFALFSRLDLVSMIE
jgi:hypothetical protein